jgi:hypothetical protein
MTADRAAALDALLDTVAAALRLRLDLELGRTEAIPRGLRVLREQVEGIGLDDLVAATRADALAPPQWHPCPGCGLPTTRTHCKRCSARTTPTTNGEPT